MQPREQQVQPRKEVKLRTHSSSLSRVTNTLTIRGVELVLDPSSQTVFAANLNSVFQILKMYEDVWSRRPYGKTAARIGKAMSMVKALFGLVQSQNGESLHFKLVLALRGKTWKEVSHCL